MPKKKSSSLDTHGDSKAPNPNESGPFLTGVIEGFYNRPWSTDQRFHLFYLMRKFGLNSYLYAPKDDHKHRAMWREAYDDKEKSELESLIQCCKENNVIFFYGISPGLDITYSCDKDKQSLKNKLDGMKAIGCDAFALLWDDIDTTLPHEDKKEFNTLAQAQVKITNDLFHHLGRPLFLTCPVEYCANRSDPNVKASEYLNTLGSGLHPDIGIFWTGAKVVSEQITKEEVIFLEKVIKRKPIIWDNLHANDYDHQRMFLGPFCGRDPNLIPHLRGLMTNPNCEFSFNIPALFTLATWSLCYDAKSGKINSWNPLSASELAIPHFLEEVQRSTAISIHKQNVKEQVMSKKQREKLELNKSDIELLFHFFWLPHSSGPKGEYLVNEFKYLRDNVHLIKVLDINDGGPEEYDSNKGMMESAEHEFLDSWLERASSFNNVCKKFSKICDKFTFIENRELFFDINSYLNSVQTVLSGCNRYLKWVGIEKCRKPIVGGPTLAGLSGGLAGDLERLYPIRSNFEYPLQILRPMAEKNSNQIQPYNSKNSLDMLRQIFQKFFCHTYGIQNVDLTPNVAQYIESFKLEAFLDQNDAKVLAIECDEVIQGCLVGTSNVKGVCQLLMVAFEKVKDTKSDLPIPIPSRTDTVPWTLLEKYSSILSLTCFPEILFTKCLDNLFQLMAMIFSSIKPNNGMVIIIDRCMPITKQYLMMNQKFSEIHGNSSICILASKEGCNHDEEMDEN